MKNRIDSTWPRAGRSALVLLALGSTILAQRSAVVGDRTPVIPPASQMENPPSFRWDVEWHTGVHDGFLRAAGGRGEGESVATPHLGAQTILEEPGVTWIRVHFAEWSLPGDSFVRVRSLTDGAVQDLDAITLGLWFDYSAFFTGDALSVELFVDPRAEGAFARIDHALLGNPGHVSPWADPSEGEPDSLCGSDDRIASNDQRVGRVRRTDGLVFCSPWLATNGAALMAGHCFDNDNNGTNELVTAGSIVEFSPPASSSSGTTNPSAVQDQYPIDVTDLDWSPAPWGVGSDWGVMALNPNSSNGDRAHVTRGYLRMTRESPASMTTIRITGCGWDFTPAGSTGFLNSESQTLQVNTGPYDAEYSSGSSYWHRYAVDTENNNSGSPIIWHSNVVSIGIHTNAGCGATSGTNQGTSFEHTPLETALRDFVSASAVFVDEGMPGLGPAEDGTVFRPYDTLAEAVSAVSSGGVVSVVEGTYSPASGGTYTISKAMTIEAPVGTVTLGD